MYLILEHHDNIFLNHQSMKINEEIFLTFDSEFTTQKQSTLRILQLRSILKRCYNNNLMQSRKQKNQI